MFSTSKFNNRFLYDSINMKSPVSYIYISPFGKSSITIRNNLLNPEYILKVKVEFSRGMSLLNFLSRILSSLPHLLTPEYSPFYLCETVGSFIFINFRLYYSKVFYYVAAALFAPLIMALFITFSLIS